MGLFDVHAHLTASAFQDDLPEILSRARGAGLTTIVSNGLNRDDNLKVLELAKQSPLVRPALGLYPVDAVLPEMIELGVDYPRDDAQVLPAEEQIEWLEQNAEQAFAIGEIGLDHHWVPEALWARQEQIFIRLVRLAMRCDLPIIIHTRNAEVRTLELLIELKASRVNWHCFSSRLKLGQRIAAEGHYLSVPANARRSETFTGLLRSLPRQQLLLETDCPYLSPEPGTRNEPAKVALTRTYAAELWGTSEQGAQEILESNFTRLFGSAP
jgi:TatD DNase family protein